MSGLNEALQTNSAIIKKKRNSLCEWKVKNSGDFCTQKTMYICTEVIHFSLMNHSFNSMISVSEPIEAYVLYIIPKVRNIQHTYWSYDCYWFRFEAIQRLYAIKMYGKMRKKKIQKEISRHYGYYSLFFAEFYMQKIWYKHTNPTISTKDNKWNRKSQLMWRFCSHTIKREKKTHTHPKCYSRWKKRGIGKSDTSFVVSITHLFMLLFIQTWIW